MSVCTYLEEHPIRNIFSIQYFPITSIPFLLKLFIPIPILEYVPDLTSVQTYVCMMINVINISFGA